MIVEIILGKYHSEYDSQDAIKMYVTNGNVRISIIFLEVSWKKSLVLVQVNILQIIFHIIVSIKLWWQWQSELSARFLIRELRFESHSVVGIFISNCAALSTQVFGEPHKRNCA